MQIARKVNIWNYVGRADLICVTTNGMTKRDGTLVMGAGIALQARNLFPELGKLWGEHVRREGNIPCFSFVQKGTVIASLPTKHDWRDKSDLALIEASVRSIERLCTKAYLTKNLLPPPGCGHGGLNWQKEVKPLLETILDERFYIVFNS